jgi:hypothetical protein
VIDRGALSAAECSALIHRFATQGLYPDDFLHYIEPTSLPPTEERAAFQQDGPSGWMMAGNARGCPAWQPRGGPGGLFQCNTKVNAVYERLFDPPAVLRSPIDVLHAALADLSGKVVCGARLFPTQMVALEQCIYRMQSDPTPAIALEASSMHTIRQWYMRIELWGLIACLTVVPMHPTISLLPTAECIPPY